MSSILLTIVMLAVGLSQMVAAGKLGQSLMGYDLRRPASFFAVIFIVYTLAGGMRAVAATSEVHLFAMYGGMILAMFVAPHKGRRHGGVQGGHGAGRGRGRRRFFSMGSIGFFKGQLMDNRKPSRRMTAQAGIQPVLAAKRYQDGEESLHTTAFVVAPFGFFSARRSE